MADATDPAGELERIETALAARKRLSRPGEFT